MPSAFFVHSDLCTDQVDLPMVEGPGSTFMFHRYGQTDQYTQWLRTPGAKYVYCATHVCGFVEVGPSRAAVRRMADARCGSEHRYVELELWEDPAAPPQRRCLFYGASVGAVDAQSECARADSSAPIVHASGAKRSALAPRYDLVPGGPLRRLADRYELGLKYGEHNYKRGLPYGDTFNHLMDHLQAYNARRKRFLAMVDHGTAPAGMTLTQWMREQQTDGDDLAAAAWGVFTLMWLEDAGLLSA